MHVVIYDSLYLSLYQYVGIHSPREDRVMHPKRNTAMYCE